MIIVNILVEQFIGLNNTQLIVNVRKFENST